MEDVVELNRTIPKSVTLSWKSVTVKKEKNPIWKKIDTFRRKENPTEYDILLDASGICEPGEILAIMGAR
jgi:hypothetical protein